MWKILGYVLLVVACVVVISFFFGKPINSFLSPKPPEKDSEIPLSVVEKYNTFNERNSDDGAYISFCSRAFEGEYRVSEFTPRAPVYVFDMYGREIALIEENDIPRAYTRMDVLLMLPLTPFRDFFRFSCTQLKEWRGLRVL